MMAGSLKFFEVKTQTVQLILAKAPWVLLRLEGAVKPDTAHLKKLAAAAMFKCFNMLYKAGLPPLKLLLDEELFPHVGPFR